METVTVQYRTVQYRTEQLQDRKGQENGIRDYYIRRDTDAFTCGNTGNNTFFCDMEKR